MSTIRLVAPLRLLLLLLLLEEEELDVAEEPPKPVYTADPEASLDPVAALTEVAVAMVVVVLTRLGFWAPHGRFCTQAAWQVLSVPQLF